LSFEVIDADRHVSEPMHIWQEYLPQEFREFAPYLHNASHEVERSSIANDIFDFELYVDRQPLFHDLHHGTRKRAFEANSKHGDPTKAAATPNGQLQSMDCAGIDSCLLYPSIAGYCVNSDRIQPALSEAFAVAYNHWLYDYCSQNSSRLLGVGLISRHDPSSMVGQLARLQAYQWRAVVLRPEPILGRSLSHVDYEPFWSMCEKYKMTVVIHGGTHLPGATTGAERFKTRFAQHACSHVLEAQMAFLTLLEGGVLERHPRLKVVFLEAGASWLPSWLWRLDEICYDESKAEVAEVIKMKPSEYFKRQCWVGFENSEPGLRTVIDTVGADRLLYGSDFPHPDHLNFKLSDLKSGRTAFSDTEMKIILSDNPKSAFELK